MSRPPWARAALSHPVFTGLSRQHLGDLIAELADPWTAAHQGALRTRRGHPRRRAAGAGPRHQLVFCDRVLVTLVILRLQLRLDGTETQVRRPRANQPGRRAFISGKRKQNTIKATTVCDGQGRTLWAGAVRPGRMHDQTAVKTEGIEDLFRRHPDVRAKVDAGYRGLAKAFGGQVHAPPPKPAKDAPAEELAAWQAARTRQSSERICVEHANAEHKQWRALQRWIGRRESYAETHLAVAGLVSDRAARR